MCGYRQADHRQFVLRGQSVHGEPAGHFPLQRRSEGRRGAESHRRAGRKTMTDTQLYLAIGVPVITNALIIGLLMKYIDSKIDPIAKNVDMLVQYMVSHEGRISMLEERTKPK